MEKTAILKFKHKTNNGRPQYYFDTEAKPKGGKKIVTTDLIEQAKVFNSFGLAGLAAQQPEMNSKFEVALLEDALMDEVKTMRLDRDLTGKN
jgi:hypothetical protein